MLAWHRASAFTVTILLRRNDSGMHRVAGMEPRTWTVEDHLAGQPADSVALYRRFVEMLEECGPFS